MQFDGKFDGKFANVRFKNLQCLDTIPKMLLIDEPSLGLSPLLAQQVLDLIVEINRQGTTILLVEQNARKSLSIADYAYVLQNGKLVNEGTGKELLNNPAIQEAYLGGRC